jgi:hypothetical protein
MASTPLRLISVWTTAQRPSSFHVIPDRPRAWTAAISGLANSGAAPPALAWLATSELAVRESVRELGPSRGPVSVHPMDRFISWTGFASALALTCCSCVNRSISWTGSLRGPSGVETGTSDGPVAANRPPSLRARVDFRTASAADSFAERRRYTRICSWPLRWPTSASQPFSMAPLRAAMTAPLGEVRPLHEPGRGHPCAVDGLAIEVGMVGVTEADQALIGLEQLGLPDSVGIPLCGSRRSPNRRVTFERLSDVHPLLVQ